MLPVPPISSNPLQNLPAVSFPQIASTGKDSLEQIKISLAALSEVDRTKWANFQDERGKTPLAHAIEGHSPTTNRIDVIRFLIEECKADVNLYDKDKWTPLYRASTGTRSDALELLLKHGARVDIANSDGSLPLHRAVDRRSGSDVLALFYAGATSNVINCFGTPLAYAAKNGDIPIAQALIVRNADVNLVNDPLGVTPLELTRIHNKPYMSEMLIVEGAVDTIPEESPVNTSLSRLAFSKDENAILQSFKNNEKDTFGSTVAHYCAGLGRVDLKKMRELRGLDAVDAQGRTPIYYATMKGHDDAAGYLIGDEVKCLLTTRDDQGSTPLMWACGFDRVTIARTMLETERNRGRKELELPIIQIQDKFTWKPIHKAAQLGSLPMVKLLIEFGADPFEPTQDGRTPLMRAKDSNAQAVIEFLQTYKP